MHIVYLIIAAFSPILLASSIRAATSKKEELAMLTEHSKTGWARHVAAEIGADIWQTKGCPVAQLYRYLRIYTLWPQVVEVLGYNEAVEVARRAFVEAQAEAE